MKRRITIKPGSGATVNGLPVSRYWRGNSVIVSGEFDFEVEDLDNYVQVKTGGYLRLTYRDPSGSLAVGDFVTVPLGWKNTPSLAEVIALGRGSYDGYTKDVSSRLVSEAL